MAKSINTTTTYGDSKSFGDRYVRYDGNHDDGITVSFGSYDEGKYTEEAQFTIDSYDLSNLAIFWLDSWHRNEINWHMRDVPDDKRHIGSIVWSGNIGISFSYKDVPVQEAKREFYEWYFSKNRNSW